MTKQKLTLEIVKQALIDADGNIANSARTLNTSYGAIKWWINKYNLPFIFKNKIIATKEQLEEAYARLGSLSLVAKEFNVTKEGIRCRMQKFDLEINALVRHTIDDDFFSRDTEEAFYWAGFIAADGCVKAHGKNKEDICVLGILLSKKDKQHLEKFKIQTNYSGKIYDGIAKGNPNGFVKHDVEKSEISITSRKMVEDLKRFDIDPRKSLIYCPPRELMIHPLFHHFLRGYFDGDGSIYSSMGKRSTTTTFYFNVVGSLDFMNIYKEIFEKENLVKIGHKIRDNKKGQTNNLMRLEYGGNTVTRDICNYLYKDATIYLQRKWERFQLIQTVYNMPVKNSF